MRCYFIKDGHIAAVEVFPEGMSDEAAVEKGRKLYDQLKDQHNYEGVEVWEGARYFYRWPPANGKIAGGEATFPGPPCATIGQKARKRKPPAKTRG